MEYDNATVTMDYSNALSTWASSDENEIRLYYCADWNFNTLVCSSEFTEFNSSLLPNISANTFTFTTTHNSAYALARWCGGGNCQSDIDNDIYVNTTGWWRTGDLFNPSITPIQSAINNAIDGSTIYVHNGTYTENVDVNKELTLIGEGADILNVTALSSSDHVFEVTANHVNISGFTLKGATSQQYAGISLGTGVEYCNIRNTNTLNNWCGIYLTSSGYNTIKNNNASSNLYLGIHLNSSSNNILTANTINSNNDNGILLQYGSSNNKFNDNVVNFNRYGFLCNNCNYNTFSNNIVNSNTVTGLYIGVFGSNNNISNNIAKYNGGYGIFLAYVSNNMIHNNILDSNRGGILIDTSYNNTIINNTASNNSNHGIYLRYSSVNQTYNQIYNNYFNNTDNVYLPETIQNHWNRTKILGTNIIFGQQIGGNFWANPTGTGFSETCVDANKDGFCDMPYTIAANNIDYLPLILDTAPPTITIISPANNSTLPTNHTWFNLTTNENSTCLFSLCVEERLEFVGGGYCTEYKNMATIDGVFHAQLITNLNDTKSNETYSKWYSLYANCSDNANNSNEAHVIFYVNSTNVIPFPDHTNPPTDPDGDGLYEDINGNLRTDFDDVVQFFKYLEWVESNQSNPLLFDFNTNGRIDFDDIRKLFNEV